MMMSSHPVPVPKKPPYSEIGNHIVARADPDRAHVRIFLPVRRRGEQGKRHCSEGDKANNAHGAPPWNSSVESIPGDASWSIIVNLDGIEATIVAGQAPLRRTISPLLPWLPISR